MKRGLVFRQDGWLVVAGWLVVLGLSQGFFPNFRQIDVYIQCLQPWGAHATLYYTLFENDI